MGTAVAGRSRAEAGVAGVFHGAEQSVVAGQTVLNGLRFASVGFFVADADVTLVAGLAAVPGDATANSGHTLIGGRTVEAVVTGGAVFDRGDNRAIADFAAGIAGHDRALCILGRAVHRYGCLAGTEYAGVIHGTGIAVVAVGVCAAFVADIGFLVAEFGLGARIAG